jgi:hypothetical protein
MGLHCHRPRLQLTHEKLNAAAAVEAVATSKDQGIISQGLQAEWAVVRLATEAGPRRGSNGGRRCHFSQF